MRGIMCGHWFTEWRCVGARPGQPPYHVRYCQLCGHRQTQGERPANPLIPWSRP